MESTPLTRRQFARRSGKFVLAAGLASQLEWLAACGGTKALATADWQQLEKLLDGTLVLPGEAAYARVSRPFNRRYDDIHPAGVALCAGTEDVRNSILWCREHDVQVTPRCGGHSYAGYSTSPGLIVDVGSMRRVKVDASEHKALVAAGARNTNIYNGLQPHGVAMSAGRCPTVGISGLTLGGGFGFSSRKLGLTSDALASTEVVTADGEVLTASARENPDLFWACRGGGGGNFGINTSYTFNVYPVGDVTLYDLAWSWSDAPRVMDALQRMIAKAPRELSCRFGAGKSGSPRSVAKVEPAVTALGQFFGSKRELLEILDPVLSAAKPTKRLISPMTFWEAKDYLYHTTPINQFTERSSYAGRLLPSDGIGALIDWTARWPGSASDDGGGFAAFAWGGAINDTPADATAFIHRDLLMLVTLSTTWGVNDSDAVESSNLDWIDGFHDALDPFVTKQAYQNFIDPALKDWRQAYYGSHLDRLVEVKKRYDPDNAFHFAQSIPA